MTHEQIDAEAQAGTTVWKWLGMFAAGLATVTMFGVIAGFSAASYEHGLSDFSLRDGGIMALIVAITGGFAYLTWRLARQLFGPDVHVPSRERRSRNILIASLAIGVVTGIVMGGTNMINGADDPFGVLSDRPISPALAIGMTLFMLIVLPWLSWQWQRTVDEHERQAYQVGAVVAAYMYLTLAPCWWMLWRGGLLPPPDGIVLYFAFNFTFLFVWMWKKYR